MTAKRQVTNAIKKAGLDQYVSVSGDGKSVKLYDNKCEIVLTVEDALQVIHLCGTSDTPHDAFRGLVGHPGRR